MVQQGAAAPPAAAPSPGVVGGDPRQWQSIPSQDMGQLVRLVQYLNAMSSLSKPVLPGGVEINQVRKVPEKTSLKTHLGELLGDENTVLHYTFQSKKFVDVEDLKALWKTDRCITHVVKAVLVCRPDGGGCACVPEAGRRDQAQALAQFLVRPRRQDSDSGLSDKYAHVVFVNVSSWAEALRVTEVSTRQAVEEVKSEYNRTLEASLRLAQQVDSYSLGLQAEIGRWRLESIVSAPRSVSKCGRLGGAVELYHYTLSHMSGEHPSIHIMRSYTDFNELYRILQSGREEVQKLCRAIPFPGKYWRLGSESRKDIFYKFLEKLVMKYQEQPLHPDFVERRTMFVVADFLNISLHQQASLCGADCRLFTTRSAPRYSPYSPATMDNLLQNWNGKYAMVSDIAWKYLT